MGIAEELDAEVRDYTIEYEETVKRTYASVDRDDDLPENS